MAPSSQTTAPHINSPAPDIVPVEQESTAAFAQAINARFSRSGTAALIPLSPVHDDDAPPSSLSLSTSSSSHPLSPPSMAVSPVVNVPAVPLPASAFSTLHVSSLPDVLANNNALILDIRPHNSYVLARIPNAVSLSVPSTLLKRPAFSLSRLAQMLPSPSARSAFSLWQQASMIVVYDNDSSVLTEGGNLLGLMRKFRNEGFPSDRQVAWLKGGFQAVWRERTALVDREPPPHEEEDEEQSDSVPMTKTMSAPSLTIAPAANILRTKHLPMSAFTLSSTISQRTSTYARSIHSHSQSELPIQPSPIPPTPMNSHPDPFSTAAVPPTPFVLRLPLARGGPSSLPGVTEGVVANTTTTTSNPPLSTQKFPHYGDPSSLPTLSPQPSMYQGSGRPHHQSLPPARPMAFNPFFDNIRQNLELSRGSHDSGEPSAKNNNGGIPLKLPRRVRRRVGELPFEWLRQIARRSGKVSVEGSSEDSEAKEESESESQLSDDEMESDVEEAKPQHPPTSIATDSGSRTVQRRSSPSTPSSRSTSPTNPSSEDLTRALAMQFYKIELGEQRRLMGVMEHHSKESGVVVSGSSMVKSSTGPGLFGGALTGPSAFPATRSVSHTGSVASGQPLFSFVPEDRKEKPKEQGPTPVFPFSITAGVEKGTKNRYRNIWPFEHARVRLLRKSSRPDDDDYMNASYVQPLGTTKRYIATQGPLPATFNDFWTLCWEQNVHVIVMLTREVESATVKCGNYWAEGTYGPLKLKLLETNDTPEHERKRKESEMASGFFNLPAFKSKPKSRHQAKPKYSGSYRVQGIGDDQDSDSVHTIKRVFSLSHTGYPDVSPRTVTQLQYLEWPDMNVPDNPRGLLELMREVEDVVDKARGSTLKVWGEGPMQKNPTAVPPSPTLVGSQEGKFDVVGSGMSSVPGKDEVEPSTGIAKHALTNTPVLLHCSAGVGRTGGFIAVDAVLDGVRREMRKRREARRNNDSTPPPASGMAVDDTSPSPKGLTSESRSSSREAMDIDSNSPSPPRIPSSMDLTGNGGQSSGLTMPVSVGQNEVHVPVAGFQGPLSVPMSVDDSSLNPGLTRPDARRMNTIKASPELLREVKRATMLTRLSSNSQPSEITHSPNLHVASSRDSETSMNSFGRRSVLSQTASRSDSRTASMSHFSSGTASRSGSGHLSVSPVTSMAGSSASLSMVMKTAKLSINPPVSEAVTTRSSVSHSVAPTNVAGSAPSGSEEISKTSYTTKESHHPHPHHSSTSSTSAVSPSQSSRLDTWRSEVRDSQTQGENAPTQDRPSIPEKSPENNDDLNQSSTLHTMTFDYTQPRRLHDDSSPPLLSTLDDPIRRVVEDMREQRMSLCQSLRQYVFVHRAILEGALMIVDDERAREVEELANVSQSRKHKIEVDLAVKGTIPDVVPTNPIGVGQSHDLTPTLAVKEKEVVKKKSINDINFVEMVGGAPPVATSPGRAKRGASPTELLKENTSGEVRLVKRPSIKRKQRSSDEEEQPSRFDHNHTHNHHPMSITMPSPLPPGPR